MSSPLGKEDGSRAVAELAYVHPHVATYGPHCPGRSSHNGLTCNDRLLIDLECRVACLIDQRNKVVLRVEPTYPWLVRRSSRAAGRRVRRPDDIPDLCHPAAQRLQGLLLQLRDLPLSGWP